MIVDSSAIVAIVKKESDARSFTDALEAQPFCRMSAATFVETAVVIDAKRDPVLSRRYDDILRDSGIEIIAVDERQARIARDAYRDYGKGSGHKARLNFGDCFAYALAKALDEPLLYKGTDFGQTDVRSALE
ncbi:MAG: type II toxin-antitoxin system VapC family toxin [Alphaproteobacteria bacterium]|nr:type II toxin-antitoxin system VapC family toxin [Alphaproteobacteria bacterium]MBV9692806.1 type II toxin-antitoxin system VapC family toxin [Alphaproteobacteria bacterium]